MKYLFSLFAFLPLFASASACAPRVAQNEVGTPAQRYPGRAFIVLPRACVTERSVPRGHFVTSGSYEVPAKTERLQAMLDTLTATTPQAIGPRPDAECGPRPDLGDDEEYVTKIRATPETLRAMHESGADHVVVLELHTLLACAQSDPWSPNDICHEQEVTVTAWVFDDAGTAVWGLTRVVEPTEEPGYVLDRVLARIPVEEPLRRTKAEFQIAGVRQVVPLF